MILFWVATGIFVGFGLLHFLSTDSEVAAKFSENSGSDSDSGENESHVGKHALEDEDASAVPEDSALDSPAIGLRRRGAGDEGSDVASPPTNSTKPIRSRKSKPRRAAAVYEPEEKSENRACPCSTRILLDMGFFLVLGIVLVFLMKAEFGVDLLTLLSWYFPREAAVLSRFSGHQESLVQSD